MFAYIRKKTNRKKMVLNFRTLADLKLERLVDPKPKAVVTTVIDEDSFDFISQFMYDNDPACEYVFDEEYRENPKQNKTELMYDVIDRMIKKHERTRDCLLGANYRWLQYQKRHPQISRVINKVINNDKPKLFFITFTTNQHSNENAMIDYVEKHLKNYKYVYSLEKESAESKRPHIHAIVEGSYFHTKKNLRPTKKYNANINIKQITTDNGIIDYITKEGNTPIGDLKYIKTKLLEL